MYKFLKPNLYNINNKDEWFNILNTEGYVVIKNIITDKENLNLLNIFKKEWKTISPKFDWDDKKTWIKENCPIDWNSGMAGYFGISQGEFMWNLRVNKNIRNIFEHIYKTKNLTASFDAVNIFLDKSQNIEDWLHQDQRPSDKRLSIQGSVNLFPVNIDDAGFVVIPKSRLCKVRLSWLHRRPAFRGGR